jgi:hypothetical protein
VALRLSWLAGAAVATLVATVALAIAVPRADAHPMHTSAVLLDIGTSSVSAEMQVPIDRMSFALGTKMTATSVAGPQRAMLLRYVAAHVRVSGSDGRPWAVKVGGGTAKTVDGVPHFDVTLRFTPPGGKITNFRLHDGVIIAQVPTHRILAVIRTQVDHGIVGHHTRALGELMWSKDTIMVPVDGGSRWQAFAAMVGMGIQHVGTGPDHLLFLLTLLLVSPLIVRAGRWTASSDPRTAVRRIMHVVTAFALGHSITLALAAFGIVHPPSRIIEFLIALSIAVSAVHALRPLIPSGESKIALSFGLVHGLAFAEVLRDLGLRGWDLLTSLLGFNLGIELTQLLVVALVMPSLWLLSTTSHYPKVRVGVGAAAMVAAGLWMLDRVGAISTSPLDPAINAIIARPFIAAAVIALVAAAVHHLPGEGEGQRDRAVAEPAA